MASNIPSHHLTTVLGILQTEFGLSDAQIQALPTLDDIKFEEQHDSDSVTFNDLKLRSPHPFKLYIGRQLMDEEEEDEERDCFAYLFKYGKPSFQIYLTGIQKELYWLAGSPEYFGSLKQVAFPFNECLGSGRFVALVKFYFLLGYRMGLYSEDPGHAVTKSWRNDLQGVCNDIIVAKAAIAKEKQRRKLLRQTRKQALLGTTAEPRPGLLPPPPSKQSRDSPSITPNTQAVRMEDDEGDNKNEQRESRARPPASGPREYQYLQPEYGSRSRAPNRSQPPSHFPPPDYDYPPQGYGAMHPLPPIEVVSSQSGDPRLDSSRPKRPMAPPTSRPRNPSASRRNDDTGHQERPTAPPNSRSRDSSTNRHSENTGRPEAPLASSSDRSRNSSASRHSGSGQRTQRVLMSNNLDQAALDAERTGAYFPSSLAAGRLMEEYAQLYHQREQIKSRMDAINAQLSLEDRQAMIRNLDNVQSPTLN